MNAIEVSALRRAFGRHVVLNDLTFAHPGGALCVLGANGAGKTTLFRCLLRLDRQYEGTIRLFGQDVRALKEREMARLCAYVPQRQTGSSGFTAGEIALMGAGAANGQHAPGARERRAAQDALERVGVAELRDRAFASLSGGEARLVLIARALAQGAPTLILDEPTAALDFGNQLRVLREIGRLVQSGLTVVFSTHQPDQAYLADRVLAMKGGRALGFGPPEPILTAPLVKALYGVDVIIDPHGPGHPVIRPVYPEELERGGAP